VLHADFEFNSWLVIGTTLGGALLTAILGLVSAMQTLGRKPAPVLREL